MEQGSLSRLGGIGDLRAPYPPVAHRQDPAGHDREDLDAGPDYAP
jgi:hypothetical protein